MQDPSSSRSALPVLPPAQTKPVLPQGIHPARPPPHGHKNPALIFPVHAGRFLLKSNVSVFREGKGSVWKRTYIPMLSYVYKNTGGENDRSGRLHGTVGTDPGNSGRKRLPGTGEEGAAVFAYAGDRYEECYRKN